MDLKPQDSSHKGNFQRSSLKKKKKKWLTPQNAFETHCTPAFVLGVMV